MSHNLRRHLWSLVPRLTLQLLPFRDVAPTAPGNARKLVRPFQPLGEQCGATCRNIALFVLLRTKKENRDATCRGACTAALGCLG